MEDPLHDEISRKIFELAQRDYHCGQMLMLLGLDLQNKSNWDLVRAVDGLKGGLGFAGKTCGALTGAVCLLGLYAGRGPTDERVNHILTPMIQELVDWFEENIGQKYGGIDCEQITREWMDKGRLSICRPIILATYIQAIAILETYGFDIRVGREEPQKNASQTVAKPR